MTITEKRKVGNTGEEIACKYISNRGFEVIERNYLRKCGELDIIASKDGKIHFIEVKSVSHEMSSGKRSGVSSETSKAEVPKVGRLAGYRPEENVDQRKLRKIKKTIQLYLVEKNLSESCSWAFDVITVQVDFSKRIGRVNMIKDIIL